jgi:sialate O-acetylesterase
MVLQRGRPVPVWGTGLPDTQVSCILNGHSAYSTVRQDGSWMVTFPAMEAGGPYTCTVSSAGETLCYTDVWVGEVWLAGGQSNMEYELQNCTGGQAVLARSSDPLLHFYVTPKVPVPGPVLDAAEKEAHWCTVGPQTAAALSAVGYFCGRKLTRALDGVHVGIVQCCWGGTPAHCWMSVDQLRRTAAGQRRLDEWQALCGEKTREQYDAENAAYEARVGAWNEGAAACRADQPGISNPEIEQRIGVYPYPPPFGKWNFRYPGNLYQTMVRHVCPYAVRGFWYYQGEEDADHCADYDVLLASVIEQWRGDWGDWTLPFLLVQLPMFAEQAALDAGTDDGHWPVLRAAQSKRSLMTANSGLVVLADCGEPGNVHPMDKKTPGERLAMLTLDAVYGQKVCGRAPRCLHVTFDGEQATACFINTAGGLMLKGQGRGFEIAGADGIFHPASAHINGDHITVHCPQEQHPKKLRYAWYSYGPAELYGGTGLAAEPFSTDPADADGGSLKG